MPIPITRYSVLISRPGDAGKEADAVCDALESINHAHSDETGIELKPLDWRRDSYADSGDEPQKLLNKQIVEKSDIVIALFKARFGTPTNDYGSGTEEEIMLALEMGKKVMLYCWNPSGDLSVEEKDGLEKIEALKRRLRGKVLYKSYTDASNLRSMLDFDLAMLLGELRAKSAAAGKPKLSLFCGDGALLVDRLVMLGTGVDEIADVEARARAVLDCLERASDVVLPKPPVNDSSEEHVEVDLPESVKETMAKLAVMGDSIGNPFGTEEYVFPEDRKAVVRLVLGHLGADEPADLFDTGKLCMRKVWRDPLSGMGLEPSGSKAELEKHTRLVELASACGDYAEFRGLQRSFSGMSSIAFVVRNDGASPAHHVRIELSFPVGMLVGAEEVPCPSDYVLMKLEDGFAGRLFEIPPTAPYGVYEDTINRGETGLRVPYRWVPVSYGSGLFGGTTEFEADDFREQVDSLLGDYRFIELDSGGTIVRISMDCVRHNAAYAFPARLLINTEKAGEVGYMIISDELAEPISGAIGPAYVAEKGGASR